MRPNLSDGGDAQASSLLGHDCNGADFSPEWKEEPGLQLDNNVLVRRFVILRAQTKAGWQKPPPSSSSDMRRAVQRGLLAGRNLIGPFIWHVSRPTRLETNFVPRHLITHYARQAPRIFCKQRRQLPSVHYNNSIIISFVTEKPPICTVICETRRRT